MAKKAQTSERFLSLDLSVLTGVTGAFAFIALAIVMSGSFGSFVNKQAAFIVLGGTFFACLASFSFADIWQSLGAILSLFVRREKNIQMVAGHIMRGSEIAYTSGILQLQQSYVGTLRRMPFLREGISCLIDGMSGEECRTIMKRRMMSSHAAAMNAVAVMNKGAEIAPAMGLIGTLIGLVQMLSNLSDPTTIGPSMSVALITTFYGALLAYVLFLPLASKLERDAEQEMLLAQLCLVGLDAIDKKENPRRTEIELNSILPADQQVTYFKAERS